MPTRSQSKSPERDSHYSRKARPRSLERSRSRDRARDRTGRDDLRDKRPRSRSRSRDRKRSRRDSYSPSRSPRRKRDLAQSRSRSRSRDRREKRRRRSYSRSSSSCGVNDDQKRRKKEKSRHKESKERRKERKKEKRDKKKKSSSTSHWGKYGIITEVDMFTKRSEFHAWLVEERKINPETLSKDQERKEFAHFIEDFNTATLPHEKFYNMEKYERRMDALRQGEFLPPAEDVYDPEADMRILTGVHKKKAPERESYMSREQLEELRKVQNERVQVGKMKLLGMDVKQSMGVRMDGTAFDDL